MVGVQLRNLVHHRLYERQDLSHKGASLAVFTITVTSPRPEDTGI
jgi:hypothetical protein